ncbi:MAG: hypothetical protein R8K20_02685 [Gallionellaceae bacterium]
MSPFTLLRIPDAPKSIQKGHPLKHILGLEAVDCLANNIAYVYPKFRGKEFRKSALDNLESLEFMDRGRHIANTNAGVLHCNIFIISKTFICSELKGYTF